MALALLALVGLVVEALICLELQRSWAGEPPGTVGRAFEKLGERKSLYNAVSLAFMVPVLGVLLYLVKGRSLGMSLPGTILAAAVFVAAILLFDAAMRRLRP